MAMESRRWIDLHMHSTASDGVYPPTKLMEIARDRGLSAVALTDHDTVSGLDAASERAREVGLEFVSGIELAAARDRGALHILGYFINPQCPALLTLLDRIVSLRNQRNHDVIARLADLGIDIDHERLNMRAGADVIGRPHIAAEMVRCGISNDMRHAFNHYLGRGKPAFVERQTVSAEEAIAVIREAGGVASLAHPSQLGCETLLELETVCHRLVSAGLTAIEVNHPDHGPRDIERFSEIAARFDLARTGGSDFHRFGPAGGHGIGFGKRRTPYSWLDLLNQRRA